MSVCTHNAHQVLSLQQHLDHAAAFEESVLEDLRALVLQLDGEGVVPLIGAGGSFDCGMPLAAQIGEDLLTDYLKDPSYAPHQSGLQPNMADVTEAIHQRAGQTAVVDALGLPDPALWPDADGITPHFCAYRVLARLAREQPYAEAVTLNYDCGYEAALRREGFLLAPASTGGARWNDHATLIADARAASDTTQAGSHIVRKLHGCAAHYRSEVARGATDQPENRIVVTRDQLTHWREDEWARDSLRIAARTRVLLLLGFSAQDAIITAELTSLLENVYADREPDGSPRIIAINHDPDTEPLRELIAVGLGGAAAASGAITQIRTSPTTTTATMLALLTETLRHRLQPDMASAGYSAPANLDQRMAALTVAAPVMLRWSYLLRASESDAFNQRVNLQLAARNGYVPLLAAATTTVRALRTREELRAALGHTERESTREALADHSFITHPAAGFAYLPCGLEFATLRGGARPGGELQMTRETLAWPKHLDCVLVAEDPGGRRGINLETGSEVSVP